MRLATLALCAVALAPIQAGPQAEISFVFHTISWGMTDGQTARFTVLNPGEALRQLPQRDVFVQVTLVDARGATIATSDEIAVPPGEFRWIDFHRRDLPATNDLGSRIQTRARVRYRSFSILDRTNLRVFPTSIEVKDDATGLTTLLASEKPKEIVVVGSKPPPDPVETTELPVVVYSSRLVGVIDGQTLRVSAVRPGETAAQQRQVSRVLARVSLYDKDGALLARTLEGFIGPGGLRSFDIDRADIPARGEPGTNRLQVRAVLELLGNRSEDPQIVTSLELVDNDTGVTAVWVTTGFFEVVGTTTAPRAMTRLGWQGTTAYGIVMPPVGLAHGQRLRLTLFNPLGTPLRARAQVHHTGGVVVALGDGSVRSNGFESFDLDRDDVPTQGEAGTGRLQLRAAFQIGVAATAAKIDGLAVSMEIIEIADGTSNTVFFSENVPVPSRDGRSDFTSEDVDDLLAGIVTGQTLRVTVFAQDPVGGLIKIFDPRGNVIGQSQELVIPQGEFRSFDIPRSALPVGGEPGTGRAQIRVQPFFLFGSTGVPRVLTSYEIVDDAGKTQVPSGQQCLVFSLGGIPVRDGWRTGGERRRARLDDERQPH